MKTLCCNTNSYDNKILQDDINFKIKNIKATYDFTKQVDAAKLTFIYFKIALLGLGIIIKILSLIYLRIN